MAPTQIYIVFCCCAQQDNNRWCINRDEQRVISYHYPTLKGIGNSIAIDCTSKDTFTCNSNSVHERNRMRMLWSGVVAMVTRSGAPLNFGICARATEPPAMPT